MNGEVMLAPLQVIDAFYDCNLTEKDLDEFSSMSMKEIMSQAKEAARALGLTGDGLGNYYAKEGVKWRKL